MLKSLHIVYCKLVIYVLSYMQRPEVLTTSQGCPIDLKTAIQTVGPRGPMLMQDVMYMDEMAHFDRERIPERVVHAKGAGMYVNFNGCPCFI